VIQRLNQAANDALAQPTVLRQFRALGVRPQGGTPEQLRQWLEAEIRHSAGLVRGARIEPL
jgi:tripartite-type tricarboxylate transporter receptor subunit TctC